MPVAASSGTLTLRGWRFARRFMSPRVFSFLFALRERAQFRRRFRQLEAAGLCRSVSGSQRRQSLRLPEPTRDSLDLVVDVWRSLHVDKLEVGYETTYASIVDALKVRSPHCLSVLEIGIFGGASLRGWRKIFSDSRIVGLDIDQSVMFTETGIQTFVANQLQIPSLEAAQSKSGENYDLIVDDGWHQPQTNINSLIVFLKHLNSGGFYVVEDVHRQEYLPFWARVLDGLPVEFVGTVRPPGTHGISAQSRLHKNSLVIIRRL